MNTLNWKGKGAMSNREKLDNLIHDITRQEELLKSGTVKDIEALKTNRKVLLAHILEMYCTWNTDGDCLPVWVQVGAYGPRFIELKMFKNLKGDPA